MFRAVAHLGICQIVVRSEEQKLPETPDFMRKRFRFNIYSRPNNTTAPSKEDQLVHVAGWCAGLERSPDSCREAMDSSVPRPAIGSPFNNSPHRVTWMGECGKPSTRWSQPPANLTRDEQFASLWLKAYTVDNHRQFARWICEELGLLTSDSNSPLSDPNSKAAAHGVVAQLQQLEKHRQVFLTFTHVYHNVPQISKLLSSLLNLASDERCSNFLRVLDGLDPWKTELREFAQSRSLDKATSTVLQEPEILEKLLLDSPVTGMLRRLRSLHSPLDSLDDCAELVAIGIFGQLNPNESAPPRADWTMSPFIPPMLREIIALQDLITEALL